MEDFLTKGFAKKVDTRTFSLWKPDENFQSFPILMRAAYSVRRPEYAIGFVKT
jgi:hypothetical protein